jgi:hypothetical protein
VLSAPPARQLATELAPGQAPEPVPTPVRPLLNDVVEGVVVEPVPLHSVDARHRAPAVGPHPAQLHARLLAGRRLVAQRRVAAHGETGQVPAPGHVLEVHARQHLLGAVLDAAVQLLHEGHHHVVPVPVVVVAGDPPADGPTVVALVLDALSGPHVLQRRLQRHLQVFRREVADCLSKLPDGVRAEVVPELAGHRRLDVGDALQGCIVVQPTARDGVIELGAERCHWTEGQVRVCVCVCDVCVKQLNERGRVLLFLMEIIAAKRSQSSWE